MVLPVASGRPLDRFGVPRNHELLPPVIDILTPPGASQAVILGSYDWPGNVRELRNCIERAFIQAEDELTLDDSLLLPCNPEEEAAGETVALPVGTTLDEAERRLA